MFKTADMRPTLPFGAGEPFLVLRENQFAVSALDRLKQTDAVSRPPIVTIYGPSGCGKSHLARHFLRDRLRAIPTLRTSSVTAAQFAADLAEASADETIPAFQQEYRELDLLICEDLGGLEGRPESQRQLLAALDELVALGAQVVCTSCKPPGQLIEMSSKLVNRLHAGICAAVELPGAASRLNLLMHFASTQQIALHESGAQLMAEALDVSPRELLASLRQLEAVGQMQKHALDRKFTRRFLDGEVKSPGPTLAAVARAVAEHFGLSLDALLRPTRRQTSVLPRQCGMYLSRELTDQSLLAIAQYYGRQNHTTVLHASRQMRQQMDADPAVERQVLQIQQSVRTSSGGARRR